jgi:chromosome segregation ATPase
VNKETLLKLCFIDEAKMLARELLELTGDCANLQAIISELNTMNQSLKDNKSLRQKGRQLNLSQSVETQNEAKKLLQSECDHLKLKLAAMKIEENKMRIELENLLIEFRTLQRLCIDLSTLNERLSEQLNDLSESKIRLIIRNQRRQVSYLKHLLYNNCNVLLCLLIFRS